MQKKALQKSIEDFSNALEQGNGAVYRRHFDSEAYEYMGAHIEKITGYTAEELTPEIWDGLILETEQQGELAGCSLEEANGLVRSGRVEHWRADVKIRARSGEVRWVSDMSTIQRSESGDCYGCLGVLLDITERKQAEKKLADLTEKLRIRNAEMAADLAMAREVQQALVADLPVRFPVDAGDGQARVEFLHRYIPAEMLAGDFFDILPLTEQEVGVLICDVVGHGVRAALLTTFLRGLIEELLPHAGDPGVLLSKMNHSLRTVFGRGDVFLFASAFYLVLDVTTGHIRYANAGHPQPLCLSPETGSTAQLGGEERVCEPALGIVEDFVYSTKESSLRGKDSLLLYTDGLVEACNADDEMYGDARMQEFLTTQLHQSAEQRMDNIIMDVLRFSHQEVFEDDVCLLAVTPTGSWTDIG